MDGLVFRQSPEYRYVLATIRHLASVRSSVGVGEDLCKKREEKTKLTALHFQHLEVNEVVEKGRRHSGKPYTVKGV